MWVIPYIITYKFSKITVSPRIMVLTNFDTPLWPRRTSRDQDLNKFESTLPLEASSQVPFFLTKWFLKDIDTMFNRERFLKNYSVIKLYSYKKKIIPFPDCGPTLPSEIMFVLGLTLHEDASTHTSCSFSWQMVFKKII